MAVEQSALLHACRIEQTAPGYQLFKEWNLYKTLGEVFDVATEGFIAADEIAAGLSRRFISHAEGRVFTSVCGAGRNRVFIIDELPELMRNNRISHINQVETSYYRETLEKFYGASFQNKQPLIFQESLYHMVCQSELDFKETLAINYPTPVTVWDYRQTKELFLIDQSLDHELFEAREPVAIAPKISKVPYAPDNTRIFKDLRQNMVQLIQKRNAGKTLG